MIFYVYGLHDVAPHYIAAEKDNGNPRVLFLTAENNIFNFIGMQNMILILKPDVVRLYLSLHVKGCNHIYRHIQHNNPSF